MKKYRKKPVVIEAQQWFKEGDHEEVTMYPPNDDPADNCEYCEMWMGDHGRISTLEGGHIVCPGDWIIKSVKGEYYPCKPDIFEATYEEVTERNNPA